MPVRAQSQVRNTRTRPRQSHNEHRGRCLQNPCALYAACIRIKVTLDLQNSMRLPMCALVFRDCCFK